MPLHLKLIPLATMLALGLCLASCTQPRGQAPAGPSPRAADPASQPALSGAAPRVVLYPAGGGPASTVRVELARTPDEHARGLMFRRELPDGTGMLFLFGGDEVRRFWMKNTLIPLDMLFFDSQRRLVGVEADTVPHDEQSRGPDTPAQYVLEVPAGYSRNHGIGPGSRVEFFDVPGLK